MTRQSHQGFTIVELLVVIVVIGILAAITIISYNGIQQRATVASLSSDLENAAKQLKLDQVDLSAYPATVAAANHNNGLKASAGTTYQYSVDNSASPQTFCITASKSTTSYYISQDGTLQNGACTGHVAGGALITNLVTNPSLESSISNWWPSDINNLTIQRVQVNGKWVAKATRQTTAAAVVRVMDSNPITVVNGSTYTASATVMSYVNQNIRFEIRIPGQTTILYSTSYAMTAGVPQRISTTGVVTNPTVSIAFRIDPAGAIGDAVTFDDVMFTQSSTVFNYADGNSPGWSWSGTTNESTSSGPVL
jgi:prepilin-type N-terminal cleavage/methylation domain-containing protein